MACGRIIGRRALFPSLTLPRSGLLSPLLRFCCCRCCRCCCCLHMETRRAFQDEIALVITNYSTHAIFSIALGLRARRSEKICFLTFSLVISVFFIVYNCGNSSRVSAVIARNLMDSKHDNYHPSMGVECCAGAPARWR